MTFSLLQMIYPPGIFESLQGVPSQILYSKSGAVIGSPSTGCLQAMTLHPRVNTAPPRGPKVLGVEVARWEGDLSLSLCLLSEDPKQSCLCHMSSYKFFWRGSLKQLVVQCPISTHPSVNLGANRHRAVFICVGPLSLSVMGPDSMCLNPSFLRIRCYQKRTYSLLRQ